MAVAAGRGKKSAVAILALALLLGGAVMSLRQVSLQNSAIADQIGSALSIEFQISTDPVRTKSRVFGPTRAPASYSFLATALSMDANTQTFHMRIPIRVIAQSKTLAHLLPGQIISAKGVIKSSKEARVAGMFLVRGNVRVLTAPSRWAKALGAIRDGLRSQSEKDDAGALIPGMVLGDTSLQSETFRESMKRSGLTHLVAVSGANFAIISYFLLWCMQWLFKSIKVRLVFTAIALFCFIALVRPSPSVLRAAAMASVVLFAKGSGWRADPIPALGFAIAAVVIADPWQARDPGFALSVLATAGLLLLAPRISDLLSKYLGKSLAAAISVPIAAVVMCAPILVALSGYLGLMTVIANLLAAPMVAPITIVGFSAALISPISPALTHILLSLIHLPAAWISGVAGWAASFPVLLIGKGFFGFAFITIAGLFFFKARKAFVVALLIATLGIAWLTRWPAGEWEIANCDVGQGDSLVINLGDHRAIAIDAGPDGALEDRCLKALGVNEIVLLVLTHFHADHVEGVAGLIRNRRVENLWVGSGSEPAIELLQVARWLKNVPRTIVGKGAKVTISSFRGPIDLRVLWPEYGQLQCQEGAADGTSINNTSVVLDIQAPDFSLFAPGDIEPCPQAQIIADRTDILKVSHHGSAYQDFNLISALSPTISLISVGAGNSYGHPAPITIAALTRLRSRIYRTDLSGSIAIRARDHKFTVRTSAGAWWKRVKLG